METRLFTTEQVKNFFEKLSKQKREVQEIYKGYDKNNPDYVLCGREMFVRRTINKWLKGKCLILYKVSEQTDLQYKQYILISNIDFGLGWDDYITINYFDYSKPTDIWNTIKINHNDALNLEGEWSKNSDLHHELLKMSYLNIPEKEYVFKRFDWSKYPKHKVKREKALKMIETTISFKCKTLYEAYKAKQNSEFSNEIYDLIEVKNI